VEVYTTFRGLLYDVGCRGYRRWLGITICGTHNGLALLYECIGLKSGKVL